ncbi:hypothetical protein ASG39_04700 [Rhizobium sp. Leaf371]|uniref:hypothetical protein n=1 Tax=Rhizobium sp. Leaf371 TaxID=1736355 RepID=UPI000715E209|nr:hypothetical protein [Rhizobium sp. Leaf371]KQS73021.1 hypothetical protein ASG39_04700 [Rhizobium sp. Leaf371]
MAIDPEVERYIRDLYEGLNNVWASIEHHSSAAEHRERQHRFEEEAKRIRQQTDEYRNEIARHLQKLSEETSKYVNVVSVIAYAGYFTTWSFTKELLGKHDTALVGLMGIVSVSLFVLWEMYQTFLRISVQSELGRFMQGGVSVEHFEELGKELRLNEARRIAILAPLHKLVFLSSFVGAIAGASVMIYRLVDSLYLY